ncbi:MAG: hypothetical protein BGN88_10120 [Clostridiales bacterium 43-6]|nr:MAG: hypothetical protein BGN88_10120 [Clostridiales bacterium 43-6]
MKRFSRSMLCFLIVLSVLCSMASLTVLGANTHNNPADTAFSANNTAVPNPYYECSFPNSDGHLWGLSSNNSLTAVREGFSGNASLTVTAKSADGNTLSDTQKVGNGATVTVFAGGQNTSYQVYYLGDINNDGKIDLVDLLLLKMHVLKIKITTGDSAVAADVNQSGKIDCVDFVTMKKHVLKINSIKQQYIPSDVTFISATYPMATAMQSMKINGRCVPVGTGMSFDWSSAGFEANLFTEGTVTASIVTAGSGTMAVIIDGNQNNLKKIPLVWGSNTVTLAQGLSKGWHSIKVYKRTEASMLPATWNSITFAGKFASKPVSKPLKIEVYGDSISCGAWNEAVNGQTSGLVYQEYEDPARSYGAFAAKAICADYSIVSVSGWGLTVSYDNKTTNNVPRIFQNADWSGSKQWDFAKNQMDAVIVNIGGNDASASTNRPTSEVFEAKYLEFITALRSKYPNAYLFCVDGMVGPKPYNQNVKNVVAAMADAKISYVQLPANMDGGGAHPSIPGHQAAADVLAAAMKQAMNLQ